MKKLLAMSLIAALGLFSVGCDTTTKEKEDKTKIEKTTTKTDDGKTKETTETVEKSKSTTVTDDDATDDNGKSDPTPDPAPEPDPTPDPAPEPNLDKPDGDALDSDK